MKLFLTVMIIFLITIPLYAGDIYITNSMPVTDGADISSFQATTVNVKWFSDTANMGQQFTTGSKGGILNGFAFQLHTTSDPVISQRTFNIRVVSFSGSDTTTISNETGLVQSTSQNWSAGDWMVFTFASPVILEANTLYGVDGQMTSGDWHSGIPYLRRPGNVYSDGQRYDRVDGDPITATVRTDDLNFHIDIDLSPPSGSIFIFY